MRLPGLIARSPNWLLRAHFCSTSSSRSGGRALNEGGKPPSPPADEKLDSSRVPIYSNRGGSFEVTRSKEAKAKGKLTQNKSISSSSSKPASNAKPAKAKIVINDQAQVSSDYHAPAEFPISHYHARGPTDLLKNSILEDNSSFSERSHGGMPFLARVPATDSPIKPKWSRRALSSKNAELVDGDDLNSSAKVAHYACIQEDPTDVAKCKRRSKYSLTVSLGNGGDANDSSIVTKRMALVKKAQKANPSRKSSAKIAYYACIQGDPIDAVKSKRPNKDSLAESWENGDDANDANSLANRVASIKRAQKHAQGGHIPPHTECGHLHFKWKARMQFPTFYAGADTSAHSGEIQTPPKVKPSRKSSKSRAKTMASMVSEGVRNARTVPGVDGKYQDSNGAFLDVQASEKSLVNVQGPLNQEGTVEARHLFDELPVQCKAEISSEDGRTLRKAKPSKKFSKTHAKTKASVVSEGLPNLGTVPGVDDKYQDSNCAFLDVQASEKSLVNVQGPPNQDVTVEARRLLDEMPVQYKVEITSEVGHAAGPTLVQESEKSSLLVAFPIKILSRWWISCYMKSTIAFTDLTHPLDMTHVWITAYQRAYSKLTGKYCDGETIRSVVKKLRDLQFTLARGKFNWVDQQHVHLPSPMTDSGKTCKTSSEVFISSAFQDDVVEQVLLLVLEPIFEARFSVRSHAFRPGRDLHTALCMVRRSFQGCAWFISGKFNAQSIYSNRVLDSVMRVVRDMRVSFLVKTGFLKDKCIEMEMEEVDKVGMGLSQDRSMRLKFLLWNVFLDQLDQWMETRIHSLSERKQNICRSPSSLLFRFNPITERKTPRMEYIRYGTSFLVGFYGSQKEAETLREDCLCFLKKDMGVNLDKISLPLLHITSEVKFLDHVISRKVIRPLMSRRSASSGRMFEKRALRIRLFLKASRQSCCSYLGQIGSPASFEEIKEILAILNNWYLFAEDRFKTAEYCKFFLCNSFVKGVLEKHQKVEKNKGFLASVKEAMRMVMDDPVKEKDCSSDKGKCKSKDRIWSPEHEMNLKELAWLESKAAMTQAVKDFRCSSTLSPQQQTVQVVWDFLKGSYALRGDYFWETETWVQSPTSIREGHWMDLKSEELAECAV